MQLLEFVKIWGNFGVTFYKGSCMNIKRTIHFKLRAFGRKTENYQIRMRVTYSGLRDDYITGYNLLSPEDWDAANELVKPGVVGSKGVRASEMNAEIRKYQDLIEDCFKYFEVNEQVPTIRELRTKFNEKIGNNPVVEMKKKQVAEDAAAIKQEVSLYDVLKQFVEVEGMKNAWTKATYEKFASLERDLKDFKKNLKFSDLTEKGLTAFVCYLRDEKVLKTPRTKKEEGVQRDRTDEVGLYNSSIEKKLQFLNWFLI